MVDLEERYEKYSLGEKFWYVVGAGWKYIVFGVGSLDRVWCPLCPFSRICLSSCIESKVEER